jgi:calcium/calmodulin-dependent protein kinase I
LLPEIRSYCTKARLRRGIEKVKLANRIEALKMQEDEGEQGPESDVPSNAREAAGEALAAKNFEKSINISDGEKTAPATPGSRLSRLARGAIFREVVLAKVREEKEAKLQKEYEEKAAAGATKGSSSK